jgi:glyoxylase-like metal-dependent hydrolase (beta-lactamase superfamily II)
MPGIAGFTRVRGRIAMRLTRDILMVGGGDNGFNISAPLDCTMYVIDGGDELVLVDAGIGSIYGDTAQIVANMDEAGLDRSKLSKLILTHYHADHAGGAAELRDEFGFEIHASPICADVLRRGDEEAIALKVAKEGGMYPADYIFRPCPAEGSLVEGHTFPVGRLLVTVFETPGHCAGHLSFLVEGGDRTYLISGDLVFYGGTIVLQNIHDCSIPEYAASTIKMAGVEFDALLTGHWTISLRDGKRHVDAAADQFRKLLTPPNAI